MRTIGGLGGYLAVLFFFSFFIQIHAKSSFRLRLYQEPPVAKHLVQQRNYEHDPLANSASIHSEPTSCLLFFYSITKQANNKMSKKQSIFDRLNDPKTFTGAHKHRFDADGKGMSLFLFKSINSSLFTLAKTSFVYLNHL